MRQSQQGLTLIELVSSIVILTIAVGGVMLAVNSTIGRSADPMVEEQAAAIAQSYLEEALLKPFCDPTLAMAATCTTSCVTSACGTCGGNSGGAPACVACGAETRATYNDICDYNFTDVGAKDQSGTALTGLSNYTVQVTTTSTGVTFNGLNSNTGQVVRVDVSVTHPALTGSRTVTGYKANY
jgi:MSHA pilin protein MshD